MATNLQGMAVWELLRGLKGLFIGGDDSPKDSIKQDVASMFDPTSDEVVLLPADTAIMAAKGLDGKCYLDALRRIFLHLKPHQREQWRRIVAKHHLTEMHEQVVTSRKTTKTGSDAKVQEVEPEGQSLRRRDPGKGKGAATREEVNETFDRREVDYEWTAQDPRVKHYLLVIDLYFQAKKDSAQQSEEEKEKEALAAISDYLLARGLITEKSLLQSGEEKLVGVKDAAVDTAYAGMARLIIGTDEYDRISGSTQEGNNRNQAIHTAIKAANARRKTKLATDKAAIFTSGHIAAIAGAILAILALVAIASCA